MRKIGIIPARYASTRLPGKPLLEIQGVPMIQRVYQQAEKADLDEVWVATDHVRIQDFVESFGGKAIMTREDHPSGTDRIIEAAEKIGAKKEDLLINIQGDEPFLPEEMLIELTACFQNPEVEISTLASEIHDLETLKDPSKPKVLIKKNKKAAYFSRSPLPAHRDLPLEKWLEQGRYFKHVGLYAFRYSALEKIKDLPESDWEVSEKLEQLRWLENGLEIAVEITEYESLGIDTEADLKRANLP